MNALNTVEGLLVLEVWSLPTMGRSGQRWRLRRKQTGRSFTLLRNYDGESNPIRTRVKPDNGLLMRLLHDLARIRIPPFQDVELAEDAGGGGVELIAEGGTSRIAWQGFPPESWRALSIWCEQSFNVFTALQASSAILATPTSDAHYGEAPSKLSKEERSIITRCVRYACEAGFYPFGATTHDGMNKAGSSLEDVFQIIEHYWCDLTILFLRRSAVEVPEAATAALRIAPGNGSKILADYDGPSEFIGAVDRVILEIISGEKPNRV